MKYPIRYRTVSLFIGGKRPFARPSDFSNKAVAIAHAKLHGDYATVLDLKHGGVKIFSRGG